MWLTLELDRVDHLIQCSIDGWMFPDLSYCWWNRLRFSSKVDLWKFLLWASSTFKGEWQNFTLSCNRKFIKSCHSETTFCPPPLAPAMLPLPPPPPGSFSLLALLLFLHSLMNLLIQTNQIILGFFLENVFASPMFLSKLNFSFKGCFLFRFPWTTLDHL